MVIAKVLVVLRREKLLPPATKIVALHIDYANRPESGREADFVAGWCDSLGVIFEKRVIDEVTRGVTDRTAYEKISREIRYGFYQQMLKQYDSPGVMFGHHLGDVQENVISNVFRLVACLVVLLPLLTGFCG
jgi:tRNA(Ile)-lysidine synthase TilS/MesJ